MRVIKAERALTPFFGKRSCKHREQIYQEQWAASPFHCTAWNQSLIKSDLNAMQVRR